MLSLQAYTQYWWQRRENMKVPSWARKLLSFNYERYETAR